MKKMKIYITPKNAAIIKIKPHTLKKKMILNSIPKTLEPQRRNAFISQTIIAVYSALAHFTSALYILIIQNEKNSKNYSKKFDNSK